MDRPLRLAVLAGLLTSTLPAAGLGVAGPAPALALALAAPSATGVFTSPEQLTYSLVSDSSHKGPAAGSSVNLLFAPGSPVAAGDEQRGRPELPGHVVLRGDKTYGQHQQWRL